MANNQQALAQSGLTACHDCNVIMLSAYQDSERTVLAVMLAIAGCLCTSANHDCLDLTRSPVGCSSIDLHCTESCMIQYFCSARAHVMGIAQRQQAFEVQLIPCL